MYKNRSAFTLVELLIVIIVIAILAAIAIPKFANSGTRSREAALKGNLKLLRNAVELFRNDTGAFPSALADLAATTAPANGKDSSGNNKTITASDFKGPYLQSVDSDPVSGSAYTYQSTSGANPVGTVKSSATGNASDGTAFSTW